MHTHTCSHQPHAPAHTLMEPVGYSGPDVLTGGGGGVSRVASLMEDYTKSCTRICSCSVSAGDR